MNSCFFGLGSNQGDRRRNIEVAISLLSAHLSFSEFLPSSIIETPALLKEKSPKEWDVPFINSVICGQTDFSFLQVFAKIKQIEKEMGRNFEAPHWSPRIIDIDILFFNNLVYSSPQLSIPHLQMENRLFVLEPLCEIASEKVHPALNKTCTILLNELLDSGHYEI